MPEAVLRDIDNRVQGSVVAAEFAVGRLHTGNEQGAINHHVGDGFVEVPQQIEQIGNVGIQRKEQFSECLYPGGSGQPGQIAVLAAPAGRIQQKRRTAVNAGKQDFADNLYRRQALAHNKGTWQPFSMRDTNPPHPGSDQAAAGQCRVARRFRPVAWRAQGNGQQREASNKTSGKPEIDCLFRAARGDQVWHPGI